MSTEGTVPAAKFLIRNYGNAHKETGLSFRNGFARGAISAVHSILIFHEPLKLAVTGLYPLNNQWFLEGKGWWAQRDLNPRPSDYESPALTAELWALSSKGLCPPIASRRARWTDSTSLSNDPAAGKRNLSLKTRRLRETRLVHTTECR